VFDIFFPKIFFFRKVEKYVTARQATDDNKMHCRKDAICVKDNEYKNADTHYS
jgi:hypothetical protein